METIIVILIIAVLFVVALLKVIKNRKSGGCATCGYNCSAKKCTHKDNNSSENNH